MKPFRSNNGLIAFVVTGSQIENGNTTIWADQVTSWVDGQNQMQSRTNQIQLFAHGQLEFPVGVGYVCKVSLKTCKFTGNNNSELTHTYYELHNVLGEIDSNSVNQFGLPSLCNFTLGGNVGSIEQKNANGSTWYNVSIALTRSFKDEQQNWQDETHWARLSISQKTFDQNFKQGLDKGDSLMVETELSTNDYTDKNGNNVTGHEFRVSRVLGMVKKFELQSLKAANQAPQNNGSAYNNAPQQNAPQQNAPAYNNAPQQNAPQQNAPAYNNAPQNGPAYNAPQQNANNAQQPDSTQRQFRPQAGNGNFRQRAYNQQ